MKSLAHLWMWIMVVCCVGYTFQGLILAHRALVLICIGVSCAAWFLMDDWEGDLTKPRSYRGSWMVDWRK
jgi:hypothetical protein